MRRALTILLVLITLTVFAKIILYTDKPNAVPVDSDFFSLQRNSDYISASVSQVRGSWFNNPQFTGNGSISGGFSAGGVFSGNGQGLTNVNGFSSNATFITLQSTTNVNIYQTNNTFVTTNITVEVPGGVTNLNLTPNSLMQSDANDAEASLPNGTGVLTNNGTGGMGFTTKLVLDEVDAKNFYPTNLFTGITNALLSTDGNGVVTNVGIGSGLSLSGNVLSASGDGSSLTNLSYKYSTNIVGASNFVFGKAYWTNITGNFTFPALTEDPAAMETMAIFVTNSGASVFTATINGVAGAPGHVVPAVFYCTNATVTEIDVSHFGVLWTNACVSKN